MMTLKQLLPDLLSVTPSGADASAAEVQVNALAIDHRKVSEGALFLAVPGLRHDGRDFIADAVAAGAVAVVYESEGGEPLTGSVPMVPVAGLGARLSEIAGRFYDEPSRSIGLIGVTGTNGKTSVSQMLAQALTRLEQPCGVIGTLGSGMLAKLLDHGMTTPDAIQVQAQLASMRDQGARWVSMEVSSHALDQGRVAALSFDLAIFTNLSRDHLDYHGDMESYGAAKARLFQMPLGAAVINGDDEFGRQLAAACAAPVLTYSLHDQLAGLFCTDVRFDSTGIHAVINHQGKKAELHSALLGAFNLSNLLAVIGGLVALDVELTRAVAITAQLEAPPGRMQRVGGGELPLVVIDYAHTPDALEKALAALRAHTDGRLTCIFGCGGDRDGGKRPLMGRAAEQGADYLVVTDDNPRSELPSKIIEQICRGIESVRKVTVLSNRAEAIAHTLKRACRGDVILLAGKGHETYQEIDGVRHPFSDFEQATRALQIWETEHA